MVSAADPYGRNRSFLDRIRYFFFQVAPQLYSLLLRKSDSAGNGTRTSGAVAKSLNDALHWNHSVDLVI
jgi:hypothetical protein